METLFSLVLTASSAVLAVPVAIFFIEVVMAVALARRTERTGVGAFRECAAILVPAHNESTGLLPTLTDIKRELRAGDRLLVVADNCTDDTAIVALAAGAEVVERHDPARRGKGYALDYGLEHLSAEPPEIVIIIDADCRLAANAIDELRKTCAAARRPAQALYLMTTPAEGQVNQKVAEFAWRVKNWLRPLGLKVLRLPCPLMGSGMAFPWELIRGVDLAGGWIVEDLKLGLDLTSNGNPPMFCPSALVTSSFASSVKAAGTQRQRWEGGHISTIFRTFPRLIYAAVTHRNWNLLALTLDLAVPPLSLLALLVIGMFVIASLFALFGFSSSAMTVSTATVLAFLVAAGLAWLKCGRDVVPIGTILSIPRYILGKLGFYRRLLFSKTDVPWIRTDRTRSG
jgi:cellulose synthase/poly-beta-1,6-N-acetylglucosamine synthase-like glycosyltransferase